MSSIAARSKDMPGMICIIHHMQLEGNFTYPIIATSFLTPPPVLFLALRPMLPFPSPSAAVCAFTRRKLIEEVEGTSIGSLGFVITVTHASENNFAERYKFVLCKCWRTRPFGLRSFH